MRVWRITGDEIGPNGNAAAHYPTKKDALEAIKAYREWRGQDALYTDPEPITIRNAAQLADELDAAMGFGCS